MHKRFLTIRRILVTVGLALALLVASWVAPLALGKLQQARNTDGTIALQRPVFLQTAHAETTGLQTFADDEAGIAAYLNLSQAVNLNVVDDVCRTTEVTTADYFLCSVGLTDYDESHDVKVYVQRTGWVLAYYPRSEPTSKIFDWRHYDGGSAIPTKLEKAIERVVQKAGSAATGIAYYHFARPDANRMLLTAEKLVASVRADSFTVNLPSSFNYFERSWSLATENFNATLSLNDQEIAETNSRPGPWVYLQGTFAASQLGADTTHTIRIDSFYISYAGLALIYKVP
jgi:hypothetical protein